MPRLSKDQIAYLRTLSDKQRRVLRVLCDAPFHMSATERSDPELYDLFRHKLVRGSAGHPLVSGLWVWEATDLGKSAITFLDAGVH